MVCRLGVDVSRGVRYAPWRDEHSVWVSQRPAAFLGSNGRFFALSTGSRAFRRRARPSPSPSPDVARQRANTDTVRSPRHPRHNGATRKHGGSVREHEADEIPRKRRSEQFRCQHMSTCLFFFQPSTPYKPTWNHAASVHFLAPKALKSLPLNHLTSSACPVFCVVGILCHWSTGDARRLGSKHPTVGSSRTTCQVAPNRIRTFTVPEVRYDWIPLGL